MTNNRLYNRHQAFNKLSTYDSKILKGETEYDSYKNALRYHHDSDKMEELGKYYVPYLVWFNEMFDVGQTLIIKYQEINQKANNQKGNLFTGKRKLNQILQGLSNYDNDLIDFRHDVAEYQRCVLATDIHQKHGYADALSDQLRFLDVIESKAIGTVDRKLTGIDNTRIQGIGIFISVCALVLSYLALK
ncbi:hypothetical protein ACWGPZ_26765 [Priestia megaterium]